MDKYKTFLVGDPISYKDRVDKLKKMAGKPSVKVRHGGKYEIVDRSKTSSSYFSR